MFVRLFLGSFILIFSIIAHRSMYRVCYLFYFPISICISVWSLVMKIPYLNHLKNDFGIEYLNYTINVVRTLFLSGRKYLGNIN